MWDFFIFCSSSQGYPIMDSKLPLILLLLFISLFVLVTVAERFGKPISYEKQRRFSQWAIWLIGLLLVLRILDAAFSWYFPWKPYQLLVYFSTSILIKKYFDIFRNLVALSFKQPYYAHNDKLQSL